MASRNDLPTPYAPGNSPVIPGGDQRHLATELGKLSTSITSMIRLLPQPAVAAPKSPVDGMVRLSRSPWRPVTGTTTDAWVYYDGPTSSWLLLHAN